MGERLHDGPRRTRHCVRCGEAGTRGGRDQGLRDGRRHSVAGQTRGEAAGMEDGFLAQAFQKAAGGGYRRRAGGTQRALRDQLPGGQGGDVALQARHGPVHARKERRGETVRQAEAVGDQAQQGDEDGFQAIGELKPYLRIPPVGERGAQPGRGGMGGCCS